MENVHWYAVRMEPMRLVAAEVRDQTAAAVLDAGQPLLLATEAELIALARRRHMAVTILARQALGPRGTRPVPCVPMSAVSPARELAKVA